MLVRTEHVSKRFPVGKTLLGSYAGYVNALNNVDLIIERGRTLALVGESGSGKTTLGQVCAGLLPPTEGKVFFKELELTRLTSNAKRKLRTDLQFIFQDPYSSLNPRHNIRTILARPFEVHTTLSDRQIDQKVKELLEMVHLTPPEPLLYRYPHQFSGGQRQRIVFARAIALRPEFIVADEPVSSVDMSVKAQLLTLLHEFQRDLNLTYLFITHELAVARSIAQDVAVMYLGRLVEKAPAEDLFKGPLHPYTQALLAATPKLDPLQRRVKNGGLVSSNDDIPSPVNLPSGCHFHTRCPYVRAICREKAPVLRNIGKRQVACHFVGDERFPLTRHLTNNLVAAARDAEPFVTQATDEIEPSVEGVNHAEDISV